MTIAEAVAACNADPNTEVALMALQVELAVLLDIRLSWLVEDNRIIIVPEDDPSAGTKEVLQREAA